MGKDSILAEINTNEAQLKSDVQLLRKWLNEQTHLPAARLKETDAFLRNYLVGCKNSMEICKQKLDNYYSYRSSGCSFYGNYNPKQSEMEEYKKYVSLGRLDKSKSNDSRYYFAKAYEGCTREKAAYCFELFMLSLELDLREEELSPMKISLVSDYQDAKLDEFLRVNPVILRDFFHLVQKVLPIRVEKLLYVNVQPALAATANYLIKPFLSKKLNERVIILSTGWETAADHIPKDIMPSEFGGEGRSLKALNDSFYAEVETKRQWFMNELNEKTDESKRPAESAKYREDFGMQGSFKSLHID